MQFSSSIGPKVAIKREDKKSLSQYRTYQQIDTCGCRGVFFRQICQQDVCVCYFYTSCQYCIITCLAWVGEDVSTIYQFLSVLPVYNKATNRLVLVCWQCTNYRNKQFLFQLKTRSYSTHVIVSSFQDRKLNHLLYNRLKDNVE